jgi:hypothetical protein
LLNLIKAYKDNIVQISHELLKNDYRNYLFPFKAGFTWTLQSKSVAIKQLDITLRDQKWTCIPQEIVSFFIGSPLKKNKATTITLCIDGKDYIVDVKRRPDGRHKLVLTTVNSKLNLNKLLLDTDTLWFECDSEKRKYFYVYTMSADASNSILPKPSRKNKPGQTTRATVGEARVGQDYFKAAVTEVCSGCCVVTGVKDQVPSILIGSHTKSWVDSNDEERMDGHNGLLLAPHVDKLFDRYLISFSKCGCVLVSNLLDKSVLSIWGIDTEKKYILTTKQHEYMDFHRIKFIEKQT